MRVGLPSNHPQFCVALATHRQYCRRAPTSWLCRVQGLGITRPAVPSERLPEPCEAWRVHVGEGAQREGPLRETRAQLTFVPGQGLAQGASPVLPAIRRVRADGLGEGSPDYSLFGPFWLFLAQLLERPSASLHSHSLSLTV